MLLTDMDKESADAAFPVGLGADFLREVADFKENAVRLRSETDYALIQSNLIAMPVTQVQHVVALKIGIAHF